jgi:hypothetical protein
MPNIIQLFTSIFGGTPRSSAWPKLRAQYLERWNWCAACGRRDNLEAHHIVPFHAAPERELDHENLLTLCRTSCHLVFGHLGDWKSHNPEVVQDAGNHLKRCRQYRRNQP